MKTGLLFLFLSVWGLSLCEAQSRKSIDTSTDILALLNPIAGFTGSLIIKDYKGTKQVVLGGLTNLAANYILEYSIRKKTSRRERQPRFSLHPHIGVFPGCRLSAKTLWLEIRRPGLCSFRLRGMGTDLCQKTRHLGCARRSCFRSRKCLYLYPSVCT